MTKPKPKPQLIDLLTPIAMVARALTARAASRCRVFLASSVVPGVRAAARWAAARRAAVGVGALGVARLRAWAAPCWAGRWRDRVTS
jgi:hypothetical protein